MEVGSRLGEVRLRQSEIADVDAVHLELDSVRDVREGDRAAIASDGTDSLDWVVKVELVHFRVGRQRLLHGRDEVLQRLAREVFTLGRVQIDVVRPQC